MMPSAQPSRRNLFVAAAGDTVGCGRTRRRPGRLTYLLRLDPTTFDPGLEDPTWFLDIFKSPYASGTGWSDPEYNDLLTSAKRTIDPAERMGKLKQCEQVLMRAMPCLPLYSDAWVYLCKPFVKRLVGNPFHGRMFNDAWIDTNWRPQ